MKFYKDVEYSEHLNKVYSNKLTCIYFNVFKSVFFFKNAKYHNDKNAAYISMYGTKGFYLNDKLYGNQDRFAKESWHRFVKMQAFL
jgi:hypothetical protein